MEERRFHDQSDVVRRLRKLQSWVSKYEAGDTDDAMTLVSEKDPYIRSYVVFS
jgi:hypothetical protein